MTTKPLLFHLAKQVSMLIKTLIAGICIIFVAIEPVNAAEKVVVMTSYPQEVITQFEAEFEKAYPQYTLEVIWKQSNDAFAFFKKNKQQIDVYWTPSRNNFVELGKDGYFLKLDDKLVKTNRSLNGLPLDDPNGFYVATEVAGLGMVLNKTEIAKLNVQLPKDWRDLIDPVYQSKIAFPIPSKIGFANAMLDAMLQEKPWAEGWRTILGVAANATLINTGAAFITEEVDSGRLAAGITMDFFAASAIAKGANLTYAYPPHVSYSPAHIAILKDAPNLTGAKAFLNFTLSEQGQTLLFHPDIRKLPVDASVYKSKPSGYFNPYENAPLPTGNSPRSLVQQLILNSMFDAMVTRHHTKLVSLYEKYHRTNTLKPDDRRLTAILNLIGTPILTEQEASAPPLLTAFSMRKKSADAEKQVREYEAVWSESALANYEKADQLLNSMLAD